MKHIAILFTMCAVFCAEARVGTPARPAYLRKCAPILADENAPADVRGSALWKKRIAFIGDSYVQNHRNRIEDTWHYKLAAKYGMTYFNYGRNGGCIAFSRSKFGDPICTRYAEMRDDLDYVVMIAGHNDAGFIQKGEGEHSMPKDQQDEKLAEFTGKLDKLCANLRRKYPKSTIVFVSPWKVARGHFEDVIAAERAAAAKHGFAFFDAGSESGVDPNDSAQRAQWFQKPNDTAHLNPAGHDHFLPVFEKFFLSLPPPATNFAETASDGAQAASTADDIARYESGGQPTAFNTETVDVWPEGKMPSVQTNQCTPMLTWYTPTNRTSDACLIVCPGGGYQKTAAGHEGYPVADWFASRGITVALLRYRTPRPYDFEKHVTAAQDAQRVVRIVRGESAARGYSADRIGMIGFSAGGHLTLVTATSSETPKYEPIDDIDKLPCNLNFAVPVYPAYVLDESGIDKKARDELRRTGGELKFAPELKFDEMTPPMCLVHGDADGHTPMGSVAVYREMRRKGLPAELHVFAKTPHGFGIYKRLTPEMPAYGWPDRVYDWLAFMGFAKKGSAE